VTGQPSRAGYSEDPVRAAGAERRVRYGLTPKARRALRGASPDVRLLVERLRRQSVEPADFIEGLHRVFAADHCGRVRPAHQVVRACLMATFANSDEVTREATVRVWLAELLQREARDGGECATLAEIREALEWLSATMDFRFRGDPEPPDAAIASA